MIDGVVKILYSVFWMIGVHTQLHDYIHAWQKYTKTGIVNFLWMYCAVTVSFLDCSFCGRFFSESAPDSALLDCYFRISTILITFQKILTGFKIYISKLAPSSGYTKLVSP